MKRTYVSLVGLLALVALSAFAAASAPRPGEAAFARVMAAASRQDWLEISPQDASQEIAAVRPFVLDVRSRAEWDRSGHVPGATLIPVTDLPDDLAALPPDLGTPILVYCGVGTRGLYATLFLTLAGYRDVRNIAGGFRAWSTADLPVVGAQAQPPQIEAPTISRGVPGQCE
ncbi:MAG TPA: rhodanese-like domain-containing protein [Trueperaceae bacterium]|nr:rhodanese-like domain-containing protein [Trueperaceae bacterium]